MNKLVAWVKDGGRQVPGRARVARGRFSGSVHASPVLACFAALGLALGLAGCALFDPLYAERAAVEAATGDPVFSQVTQIAECPADPAMLKGNVITSGKERKPTGIAFVAERERGADGAIARVHWMPTPEIELDGALLDNRFFERILACEFGERLLEAEDPAAQCFAAYCPCAGDPDWIGADGKPVMLAYDTYLCQMRLQRPDDRLLALPPAQVEQASREMRAAYRAAMAAADPSPAAQPAVPR